MGKASFTEEFKRDAIRSFPVRTIADARLKAEFMLSHYTHGMDREDLTEWLPSFLPSGYEQNS